jgi:serine protease
MFERAVVAALWVVGTLASLAWPVVASAQPAARLRLMLHPLIAPGGAPAERQLDRLQALSGLSWQVVGTTRTGALELTLASPVDRRELEPALARLRADRAVLWADVPRPSSSFIKRGLEGRPTDRIIVRLAPGVAPAWAELLPRFATLVGQPLSVERESAGLWILQLAAPIDLTDALFAAERMQNDPAVQYADPVKRVQASRTANDPLFRVQWGLSDPIAGINAPDAWDISTGASDVVVAVVDTGVLAHPDLAGRLLPGYDFVSDPVRANDGDGRDADATDPGDWTWEHECSSGSLDTPSSWHGTFVAGIIAADGDNAGGIAGVDWNAKILPVRVMGKCGGTDLDALEGVLWSAGLRVAGAPLNRWPARVINLSLGGYGPCSSAMQQAIDAALIQGAAVVAAAGNDAEDVADTSPANCAGVITVSAHQRSGERAGYSNYGPRVDVSAPGGAGEVEDWVVSLSNSGDDFVEDDITAYGIGTSFAAPHVSGIASLLISKNRMLTPGKVLTTVQGSSRRHPSASGCAYAPICGAGLADAAGALRLTSPASESVPSGAINVVEYYRDDVDRYFITSDALEIAALDAGSGPWRRTGHLFYAYASPDAAPGLQPVCRFYGSPAKFIDSHYFTANPTECAAVSERWAGTWNLENPAAFYVPVPTAAGNCPSDTLPVYRFFNGKQSANHRYTLDLTVRRTMLNRSWIAEGEGVGGIAFCAPL